MIRRAFLMSVNPTTHEEYRRRHDEIWPEMKSVLSAHGAHNYSIYLDRNRSLLFGYVEVESSERWDAIATTDACRRWWGYMRDVMYSNPDGSPVSEDLEEVFHLA
jgi:L-rhamnose mutarotase